MSLRLPYGLGGANLSRVIVLAISMVLAGCQVDEPRGTGKQGAAAKQAPVVNIAFKDSATDAVTSWSANVVVTQSNNRSVGGTKELQRYAVRTKLIDGRVVSRIDLPPRGTMGARTVVTDGQTTVVADTGSGAVLNRVITPTPAGLDTNVSQRLMGRVSSAEFVAAARKLSYDVAVEDSGRWTIVSVPEVSLVSLRSGAVQPNIPKNYQIVFDTIDETIASTVLVEEGPDGTVLTTTTTNQYQMVEDQPILIGQVIEEEHTIPGSLPLGPDALPAEIVPEALEEVTQGQLEEMAKTSLVVDVDPIIGDRSDPSYTLTTFIQYSDIELNGVDEAAMRILLGGQK